MHTVLSQEAKIPALGFGTFELDEATTEARVLDALETGYRHVDTARVYGNEAAVGRAIAASGVPRSEVFLTTKLWFDEFTANRLEPALRESLERLDTPRADLVLLHWPNGEVPLAETLEALARVREQGLVRHCGLSNFPVDRLEIGRAHV